MLDLGEVRRIRAGFRFWLSRRPLACAMIARSLRGRMPGLAILEDRT
jgi:hypothetical protein